MTLKSLLKLKRFNGEPISREDAKAIREMCALGKGLREANTRLGACGVESFLLPDDSGRYRESATRLHVQYVNMGDTYDLTLCKVNGTYRVASWGDIVESYDQRFERSNWQ